MIHPKLCALAGAVLAATSVPALAEEYNPVPSAVWQNVAAEFFGDEPVVFDDRIEVLLPNDIETSHDVPLAVRIGEGLGPVAQFLIIAEYNPIQEVARIVPHRPINAFGLKIRLEMSTAVRAAALTEDGVWHVGSQWVNVLTPGGCGLSGRLEGGDSLDARLGEIAFRTFDRDATSDRLKMRIIHPMETGFATGSDGELIPAYYVEKITITDDTGTVAELFTQAAMASDPIITLDMPALGQTVRIEAQDSRGLAFEAFGDGL